jgi:gliding motility-associated lipoprotein GldH
MSRQLLFSHKDYQDFRQFFMAYFLIFKSLTLMKHSNQLILIALMGFMLFSCQQQHVFHSYQDLPSNVWVAAQPTSFQFEVKTAGEYVLSYHLRNTREYPFYNLYVQYELLDEQGKILRQQLHESNLMHPKTGAPLGNGESLYDHSVQLFRHRFDSPGQYQFKISQYMRLDSLQGVQAVGLTIDAVK